MSSAELPKYTSLGPSSKTIRLIEISPGSDQLIACKFHIHELSGIGEADLSYAALSYTWGVPEPTSQITIDGQRLTIRQNLWFALSSMRSKMNEGEPEFLRLFWIDAICINQQDIEERSHQVNMMKEIFSQAALVLVWLGPEEHDSSIALQTIARVKAKKTEATGDGPDVDFPGEIQILKLSDVFSDRRRSSKSRLYRPPPIPHPRVPIATTISQTYLEDGDFKAVIQLFSEPKLKHGLAQLCRRAYWRRLWIVQEVLSATHLLVLCGDQICEWVSFESLVLTLKEELTFSPAYNLMRRKKEWTRREVNLCFDGPSLVSLIKDWCIQECGDPRDRIFGLLGLGNFGDRIIANYDKTPEEVFDDVWRALHKFESRLEGQRMLPILTSSFAVTLARALRYEIPLDKKMELWNRVVWYDDDEEYPAPEDEETPVSCDKDLVQHFPNGKLTTNYVKCLN